MLGFVGQHIHICPGLTDQIHRHGFLFRVVHGDKIRVNPLQNLPAGGTLPAGPVRPGAENGRGQQPGQGMLSGALRAGDQIKVGNPALFQGQTQIFFGLVVAQQRIKAHDLSPTERTAWE